MTNTGAGGPDGPIDVSTELIVRPERQGDHPAIADVVAAAFGSPAETRLVEAIRSSDGFVPELAMVAELDRRVVGHVMISHATLVHPEGQEWRIPTLSPLAVHPAVQRRGVGAALVSAVTAEADRRGAPMVVLEGDPRYYGRFGFEHSLRFGITINLPSWAPPEAAQVLRLTRYEPAMTGGVVYPPAFDEFAQP